MKSRLKLWRDEELGVDLLRAEALTHKFSTHAHPELLVAVFEAGAERFRAGGKTWIAAAGDILVLPPGLAHDGEAHALEGYTYRALYVQPARLQSMLFDENLRWPQQPMLISRSELTSHVLESHRQFEQRQGSTLEREERLSDVLKACLSETHKLTAEIPRSPRAAARAREFLHENFAAAVRTADLAAVAGISESRLAHVFSAAYQCSPGVYQTSLRLSAARRMLHAGIPATTVAAELGFADQAHFTRRFKEAFGVTPGSFR